MHLSVEQQSEIVQDFYSVSVLFTHFMCTAAIAINLGHASNFLHHQVYVVVSFTHILYGIFSCLILSTFCFAYLHIVANLFSNFNYRLDILNYLFTIWFLYYFKSLSSLLYLLCRYSNARDIPEVVFFSAAVMSYSILDIIAFLIRKWQKTSNLTRL